MSFMIIYCATLIYDDIKYFSVFLREFKAETYICAALVGAALIYDRLVRLLKAHFLECKESEDLLKGGSAPLGAFSARIKMAYCLGLITDLEYKECDYMRRSRNGFAHTVHGLTFKDTKVPALW